MRQILDFIVYYPTVTATLALAGDWPLRVHGSLRARGSPTDAAGTIQAAIHAPPADPPTTTSRHVRLRSGRKMGVRQRMLRRGGNRIATIRAGEQGKRARSANAGVRRCNRQVDFFIAPPVRLRQWR